MPPLVIQCVPLQIPSPPPSVTIPNFGIMQQAWGALDDIPDPADLLGKFQNALAVAMAPVRRYLEIVEVLQDIQLCLQSVIDAINQLSPDPIFDCFKKLAKDLARVLAQFPPLAYVRTAADLASYSIDVLDEIFDMVGRIDETITDYTDAFSDAQLVGDSDLIAIVGCGASEVLPHITVTLDLVAFITPLNNALMEMFTRLMPNPILSIAKQMYEQTQSYVLQVQAQFKFNPSLPLPPFLGIQPEDKAQHQIVPVPPLGLLFQAMNHCRNAMVMVYNVMAPVVGLDADKQTRSTPTYTNF